MRLTGLATTFPKQTSCLLRTLIKNRGEYHSLTRIDVQQRPQRPVRYKPVPQMTQLGISAVVLTALRNAGASRHPRCTILIFRRVR